MQAVVYMQIITKSGHVLRSLCQELSKPLGRVVYLCLGPNRDAKALIDAAP